MNPATDLAPYPTTVAPLRPAHIRHYVRQAAAEKAAAMAKPTPDHFGDYAARMLSETRETSVLQLARQSLRYAKYRALATGGYGCLDASMRRQWNAIAHGMPAKIFDYARGETVTRVTGVRP